MEKYIVDGQGYEIKPEDLELFLKKFPNAMKYEELGKITDSAIADPMAESNVMGSNLEGGFSEQQQNINPETGKEYTFSEKLSNIFEPVVPGFVNLGNEFAQTGVIAIDKLFKTLIPSAHKKQMNRANQKKKYKI